VIKLTELAELAEELTKQLIGVAGTELVDQSAKLRQLVGLVRLGKLARLAKLVNQLAKLRQLVGLVRMGKLARLAKLVDQLTNLLDQLVGGAERVSLTRLVGLNGSNGFERQSLLLIHRVRRLDLAHRNPRHRSQGRSGYRGGPPSPQPRSEYLHRGVT
jgi:hypothetical protein